MVPSTAVSPGAFILIGSHHGTETLFMRRCCLSPVAGASPYESTSAGPANSAAASSCVLASFPYKTAIDRTRLDDGHAFGLSTVRAVVDPWRHRWRLATGNGRLTSRGALSSGWGRRSSRLVQGNLAEQAPRRVSKVAKSSELGAPTDTLRTDVRTQLDACYRRERAGGPTPQNRCLDCARLASPGRHEPQACRAVPHRQAT